MKKFRGVLLSLYLLGTLATVAWASREWTGWKTVWSDNPYYGIGQGIDERHEYETDKGKKNDFNIEFRNVTKKTDVTFTARAIVCDKCDVWDNGRNVQLKADDGTNRMDLSAGATCTSSVADVGSIKDVRVDDVKRK